MNYGPAKQKLHITISSNKQIFLYKTYTVYNFATFDVSHSFCLTGPFFPELFENHCGKTFTGPMPFLSHNQHCQSTEGVDNVNYTGTKYTNG